MAYVDMISLKYTIKHLLNSSDNICLDPPSRELIEVAYKEVQSLEMVLQRFDRTGSRKKVKILDGQMREAICKLEDVIESHVSSQIVSQSRPSLFSVDLQDLCGDVCSFVGTMKKMSEEYSKELDKPWPDEDEDAAVPLIADIIGNKSKVVGLFDQFTQVKDWVTMWFGKRTVEVIKLVGMAGIGKTTLAMRVFYDPDIMSNFQCRAWVTVGRTYKYKKVLRSILVQVNNDSDTILMEGDGAIAQYLKKFLDVRSYFIVLDDVWDICVWNELGSLFEGRGLIIKRVLLTTRRQQVAQEADSPYFGFLNMRLMNKEESWDLFREIVFGEATCAYHLETVGKKIAENCEGLPLLIVEVASLLSGTEQTVEYWNKVAEEKNSVFMDAHEGISEVILPSYEYLSQYLKPCFLYTGVFPRNYEISLSKLTTMWIVEGLIETNKYQTLEDCAVRCLKQLVLNSVVSVYQMSARSWIGDKHRAKTCGLHSSFRHFCSREARKNKFFHVLDSYEDALGEGMKSQRRLCCHNNVLFGIKDVRDSLEYKCAPTARSLLFFGPYHPYPILVCFGLRLLRVFDALRIRFYEFPLQLLELVQLKYLALTFNGKLPSTISKLWTLQFLIVGQHLRIKSTKEPFFLPKEIWDMKELKHLQVMGRDLPDPCRASLPNLTTLLDVSAHNCSKEVLEGLTNLKKLGIRIELGPNAEGPWFSFDHIVRLHGLETFKCVILNPKHRSKTSPLPTPLLNFPSNLQKLTLNGLGYPWEVMSTIASLPNLKVLKLRCNAFQGSKWEIEENRFLKLSFLLIEDTDLEQLIVGRGSFRALRCLRVKHCYKLKDLCFKYYCKHLHHIQLIHCNPLAFSSTIQLIKSAAEEVGYFYPNVYVHSLWDDGNPLY